VLKDGCLTRLRYALALSAAALVLNGAAARADEPKAVVRGEMPADLRAAIEKAIGEAKTAPGSRLEARRRAAAAAEDATAVLRSAGFYAYVVEPDVTDTEPGRPIVTIDPGPQFHIKDPTITWEGTVPPRGVQGAGFSAIQLDDGQPARAGDVLAAEGRVIASTQKLGYADAILETRVVTVDHADKSVHPEYKLQAGDLVRLDGVDVRTDGRTNPAWVRRLGPWKEGDVYDPDDVAELERRLLDAGVYDSVTVSLAPKDHANDKGNRPVVVSLAEKSGRLLELGAGYSTTEGAGIDGRITRYNRLARADTQTLTFRLAEIEQKLDYEIALPHWHKPQQTLKYGGSVYQDLTDAYDEAGLNARIDLTQRYGYSRTSYRTYGLALDITHTDQRTPTVETVDLVTVTGLAALAWDRSNDPLNPTKGWRFDGRVEPTYSLGDINEPYLRVQAQVSGYLPFGSEASTVLAGRFKLGSVIGGSLATIPAARRLYAGGGGSVRGYSYQGVGPRLTDNTPQGGLSLFEGSFEIRQKFGKKWGGVAFLDVGGIGTTEAPDFSNVSSGVGLGVRYDLGFGPIRADIAVPVDRRAGDPAYQIYLSIGQSF
jgi:translocation and assembly module TamA